MTDYKKRLENKRKTLIILLLLLLVITIGAWVYSTLETKTAVNLNPSLEGIQSTLFIGIFAGFIFQIVRISKLLKNEETLKKAYISANDERNIEISRKVGYSAIYYTMFLLGVATIIAGFFNYTVFMTLGFALIGQVLLFVSLLIYARKKL